MCKFAKVLGGLFYAVVAPRSRGNWKIPAGVLCAVAGLAVTGDWN